MTILLAIDGSPHSQAAVDEVARRPWPSGSTIRVMSVIQPYTPPATEFVLAGATLEDIRQQQVSSAEQIITRAADALKETGVSTETAVREGDPRSVIVDEADEWGADLIVVGSHGRTGLTRWRCSEALHTPSSDMRLVLWKLSDSIGHIAQRDQTPSDRECHMSTREIPAAPRSEPVLIRDAWRARHAGNQGTRTTSGDGSQSRSSPHPGGGSQDTACLPTTDSWSSTCPAGRAPRL
jgi:nucleotide-binding universal stress UspA family protein